MTISYRHPTAKAIRTLLAAGLAMCALPLAAQRPVGTALFGDVAIGGELNTRIMKNFDRLEETKYQPDHVFLTDEQSGGWPGDTEGRTLLGLVLEARATGRMPKYADEIVRRIPSHLNTRGYMGAEYDIMNEQQLSGNGWMLRALCEYYRWKKSPEALGMIKSISSLFMNGKGRYATYSLNPDDHKPAGGASGNSVAERNGQWLFSTDVGCVFIGMDGFIQAYDILRDPAMRPVAEEMIRRFLAMDLHGIKAQTHATLTACRGLLRFADITGDWRYVGEAARRFDTYVSDGMTESFANYNWFDRYDTWTEPCAIVDSYMLAVQLWQHTRRPAYLQYAERIYFNAICRAQRANGGFGLENCPGTALNTDTLAVHADEAHWCCTMRGGEGLAWAVQYAAFEEAGTVYVPFFHNADIKMRPGGKLFAFSETTSYPFSGNVDITVSDNQAGTVTLKLAAYAWNKDFCLSVNGRRIDAKPANGFISVTRRFAKGDKVSLAFDERGRILGPINKHNTARSCKKVFYGPLLLGAADGQQPGIDGSMPVTRLSDYEYSVGQTRLTPVYHLMSPDATQANGLRRRILWQ